MQLRNLKKNLIEQIKARSDERLFFMDEARFGTHSKLGHGWFPTGMRSRVEVKLGFENFYMYSAVEVGSGESFNLLLPKVNTDLMNIFLREISIAYKDDKITMVMDGAGWHKSKKLVVPENICIIYLPPYTPELNPVERLWLHTKRNTIKNKIYDSLKDLENEVCNFLKTITNGSVAQICAIDWFN